MIEPVKSQAVMPADSCKCYLFEFNRPWTVQVAIVSGNEYWMNYMTAGKSR